MKHLRYYRNLLAPPAQKAYDAIERGLLAHARYIPIPFDAFPHNNDIAYALQMDCPTLFYVDFGNLTFIKTIGFAQVQPAYRASPGESQRIARKLDLKARQIVARTVGMTSLEKELYLHDVLARNIQYDHDENRGEHAYTLVGALLHRRAVCLGISKAFMYLAGMADLPAMIVTGHFHANPEEYHAWNIVYLGGQPYHLDVTNDHAGDAGISRAYLNMSDARMKCTLKPIDDYPLPVCPKSLLQMPVVRSLDELIDFLRREAKKGSLFSQCVLSRRFEHPNDVVDLVMKKAQESDYGWLRHMNAASYRRDISVLDIYFKP